MVTFFGYPIQTFNPGDIDESLDRWMLAPDQFEQQVGTTSDKTGAGPPFGEDLEGLRDRGWRYVPVEQQPVALHLMELHDNSVRPLYTMPPLLT